MTPARLLRETAARFRAAGIPDPETDGALLLSSLCGKPPLFLRLDTDTELDPAILESFRALESRRLSREPLQYIMEETPFCGRLFHVDPRVLIPRPETELLCAWALEQLPPASDAAVLDLCCGSGCIGLTLAAERPSVRLTLSDLSPDALDVARLNADRLGLSVSLRCADLAAGLSAASFDCVLSNPPYIPSGDCPALQPEVLREPSMALDGGPDGLSFYRRIASESAVVLKERGFLLMELGDGEADPVQALLRAAGFENIRVRKDLRGLDRMILADKASVKYF